MVDVAGDVAARAAVNRPLGIHPKEILATTFFDFFIRNARTRIFGDSLTFGNRLQSKQSKTSSRAPYFVFSVSVIFTQCSIFPLLCPINFSLSLRYVKLNLMETKTWCPVKFSLAPHDKLKLIGH